MESINNVEIRNKRVILRLDLNVTIKDNKILDDSKIKKSIKTLNYLLDKGNHILIMSHLGRIKTKDDMGKNSLKIVGERLEKLINRKVIFINKTRGDELEASVKNNEITLMENTRFEDIDNKKESSCDLELASYWASLGDVFVNDAFATTHRKHASNYGISKYLETYIGFLIEEEVNNLSPLIESTNKNFVVLMGGAKVDDKIQLIKTILENCRFLLVGGGIANTFLKASNYEIGKSLYSENYILDVKNIINNNKSKIIMPIDYIVERDGVSVYVTSKDIKKDDIIYDIGQNTIDLYNKYLKEAELIFINGTVGMYENVLYENGTKKVLKSLKDNHGIKIVGGGDALSSINKFGFEKFATYISTGGGATLEYIANKKLECFED